MKFTLAMSLAASLLLPQALAGAPPPGAAWCGSEVPSEESEQALVMLQSYETAHRGYLSAQAAAETITIPLYMHGLRSPGEDSKSLDEAALRRQFDVMNKSYAAQGIRFELKGVDVKVDADLADFDTDALGKPDAFPKETQYLRQSRKGGYGTLNLYFHSKLARGLNGVCPYPVGGSHDDPASYYADGCHILAATMPGGSLDRYNVGFTAVHETGHWLGLMHPWGATDGKGCEGEGDKVKDTPAQKGPTWLCPKEMPDTCPGSPGKDNGNNYMDYADDTCWGGKQHFTAGQRQRMHTSYNTLRK